MRAEPFRVSRIWVSEKMGEELGRGPQLSLTDWQPVTVSI